MKALVYNGPEDMTLNDIDVPKIKDNEVLIQVHETGICGSDVHGYMGKTGRRIPPMVMGHEFSGVISRVGKNVTGYEVGDRVTAQPGIGCGECDFCKSGHTNLCPSLGMLGVMSTPGSLAEFMAVPAHLLYKLPDGVSFEYGAMIEPLAVGYSAVMKVPDLEGENVLVVGSGTIGLMVLQVLTKMKCKSIIVSDLSDYRLELAKKIGADYVINPANQDMSDEIATATGGMMIDVAFEVVGIGPTVNQAIASLHKGGTCVWVGNSAKMIEINMQSVVTRQLRIQGTYAYTHEEFGEALDFLLENKLNLDPIISAVVSLEEGPEYFHKLAKDPGKLIKVLVSSVQ